MLYYIILVFMTGFVFGVASLLALAFHILGKKKKTQEAMTSDERVRIRHLIKDQTGIDMIWSDGKLEPWKKSAEGP